MNRTGPRLGSVAALRHLAHVTIDADDQRPTGGVQHAQRRAIDRRDERPQHRVGVHQRGMHGQHARHAAPPGDPRGDEREVEELAVLMHDIGIAPRRTAASPGG